MKVCYFGTYDADYVRNRVLTEGLRANGVQVAECHSRLWFGTPDKVREVERGILNPRLWLRFLKAYLRLLRNYLKVGRYDVMVVGYAGHIDVFLARILASLARKPLVFDAFLSLHDTIVEDRGLAGAGSMIGSLAFWLEKLGCLLSDVVLLDTEAHIHHFSTKYTIPKRKFRRVWVGADEKVYYPLKIPRKDQQFTVIYFGKFIPLHGVEHVVRAAKGLEAYPDIRFEFIGRGQTYHQVRCLAEELQVGNIIWGPEWLEPPELRQRIAQADVCLGIFGTSPKAEYVIPAKAYIALAMRKPLITRDSPAVREIFISGENALLCPAGDGLALANSVLTLRRNPDLRKEIAHKGFRLFQEAFSSQAVGLKVKEMLREIAGDSKVSAQ